MRKKKKENQPAGCSYVALKITRHLVYDFFASYHFHEMQKCRVRISIVIIVWYLLLNVQWIFNYYLGTPVSGYISVLKIQ